MRRVRLILVRHGESEWNAAGLLQGHGGPGLTARGKAQAEVTARLLARDHADAAAIVRSDLERVSETAAPTEGLLAGTPVLVDERLRELDLGSWTGMTRAEAASTDPDGFSAWARGEAVPAGGAESFADLRARVTTALSELARRVLGGPAADRPATVLVFTHGGPIRASVAAAVGVPLGGHRSLRPVGNCAISVLDVPPPGDIAAGSTLLVAYNRTDHLTCGEPR